MSLNIRKILQAAVSLIVGGLMLFAAPARAVFVYNNLGSSLDGSDTVFSSGPLADSFSTGGQSHALRNVSIVLASHSDAYSGTLSVGLYADAGNTPGAFVASLGDIDFKSISVGTFSTYSFSPALPPELAANTRYWVEVSSALPSDIDWAYSNDISGVGVAGEFSYSAALGVNPVSALGAYQMSVVVPEPSVLALFAMGLAGLSFGRRRKS